MTTQSTDPYSLVYDAIVTAMQEFEPLTSLVQLRNWKLFGDVQFRRTRPKANDSDRPELRIAPTGGPFNLFWTSSSARFDFGFLAEIKTESMSATRHLFPVQWALMRSLKLVEPKLVALSGTNELYAAEMTFDLDDAGDDDMKNTWTGLIQFRVMTTLPRTSI